MINLQQNLEQLVQVRNALRFELDNIHSSISWKIIMVLQKIRGFFQEAVDGNKMPSEILQKLALFTEKD